MTKHCNEALKKAQAALEAAQSLVDLSNKEAEAAEKQKADAEKKRADVVLFEISGANGLVCRCRFHPYCGGGPTWVVPHTAWIRGIRG